MKQETAYRTVLKAIWRITFTSRLQEPFWSKVKHTENANTVKNLHNKTQLLDHSSWGVLCGWHDVKVQLLAAESFEKWKI